MTDGPPGALRRPRRIMIVGAGVVGTATGLGFAANGHQVQFCDVSPDRVAQLREQGLDCILADSLDGAPADAYFLSVPTPTVEGQIDLSALHSAAESVGRTLASHPGWPLVVVRSTVPPGTTEGLVVPVLLFTSGRRAGRDFGVCMNPEFLRARSAAEDFLRPRVIVIGALDPRSDAALRELYAPWPDVPIHSMSIPTAEATKYAANLFNATKISFFNELHAVFEAAGAEPAAAFDAVTLGAEGLWNPGYGTRSGEPYGGACLPKDTVAFRGFAESIGLGDSIRILRAVIEVNEAMEAAMGLAETSGEAAVQGSALGRPAR